MPRRFHLLLFGRTFQSCATCLALIAACLLGPVRVGVAQQIDEASGQTPAEAPRVDWSHAERAHRQIESWVAAGAVNQRGQAQPIHVTDALGVRVTLRWSGLILGVGDAIPVEAQPKRVADLAALSRTATARALLAAEEKLNDLYRKSLGPDGSVRTTIAEAGARMQVDLQVAHSPQPLFIQRETDYRVLYRLFAPGYHGLRMTRHSGVRQTQVAWIWPVTALTANISPRGQLRRLLTDLGYDLKAMQIVARKAGPRLERFEVIHVVRPSRDMPAMRLVRGNDVLPLSSLSSRSLEGMAHRLTEFHLRRRRSDGQMAGTYHPSTDRYEPATAPARDLALATYALGKRAEFLARTDPGHAQESVIRDTVRIGLETLLEQLLGSQQQEDEAVASALTLMAMVESPDITHHKTQRDELADRLLALRNNEGLFRSSSTGKLFNRPTQALVVLALSSLYEQTRDGELKKVVAQSQQRLWQGADTNVVLSGLPWLAMTEFRMLRLGALDVDADQDRWRVTGRQLGELADTLRRRQITSAPTVGPADVVGGFDLKPGPASGVPEPEWHSAHVLMFLAAALRQRDLAFGRDVVDWLLDGGLACRFLAQLMFDEPGCFYVRSPNDALGGVRASLWDNRLSIGPAAMTLLAVTELQEAASEMAQAGAIR